MLPITTAARCCPRMHNWMLAHRVLQGQLSALHIVRLRSRIRPAKCTVPGCENIYRRYRRPSSEEQGLPGGSPKIVYKPIISHL